MKLCKKASFIINDTFRYTQCESMSLYYKIPILLIEFDQSKSFTLQVKKSKMNALLYSLYNIGGI
jgi:ERCC4-type nuclease